MVADAAGATQLLALSDERDQQLCRIEAAWGEGWGACLDYLADHVGGRMHPVRPTNLEILRWGPRGREHAGDPRPGDFCGGMLPLEHPGKVWVGSAVTHYHACAPACYRVAAGWYTPAEAAEIGRTLPGRGGAT